MKISIAMATFNGARFIQEQLNSFCQQTVLPDELVVYDDGSDDGTAEIVIEFSKQAPFPVILIENTQRIGITKNFSNCLMKTTGDVVFLSDQDDYWFPEKIATIAKIIKPDEPMLLWHDAELADGQLNDLGVTLHSVKKKNGRPASQWVSTGCCVALTRPLLNLALPIPPSYVSHDKYLTDFSEIIGVRVITPQVLQFWRRHGNNVSKFSVVPKSRTFFGTRAKNLFKRLGFDFKQRKHQKMLLQCLLRAKTQVSSTAQIQIEPALDKALSMLSRAPKSLKSIRSKEK
jgi:glycosyltransferase involved in cell wall biosynthesis